MLSVSEKNQEVIRTLDEFIDYRKTLSTLADPDTPNPRDHTFSFVGTVIRVTGIYPSGRKWVLNFDVEDALRSGDPLSKVEQVTEELTRNLNRLVIMDLLRTLAERGVGTLVAEDVYKCDPVVAVPGRARRFFEQYGILVED